MRSLIAPLAGALLLLGLSAAAPEAVAVADDGGKVQPFTIEDPRITESSGLAASRVHPGVYWTHNDSDDGAYLYAVDSRSGKTVARVTLTGVGRPRDVEAISMGPHNTLYVGDIGDNLGGKWPHVWIYALPEPKELRDQTVKATQYTVQYDDGPRDAEALMVQPKTGRVYIADKKEDGGSLYEGPAKLSADRTNVFKRIAATDLWVTDGAFSPDGTQLALRGYFGGVLFDWRDGRPKRHGRLTVPLQTQGESITYTLDGSTLMYGSEGVGSKVQPGQLPRDVRKPGTAAGASADGKSTPSFAKGALVLLLALAVVFGGRKLLRRG